jgi:hypothetical protein
LNCLLLYPAAALLKSEGDNLMHAAVANGIPESCLVELGALLLLEYWVTANSGQFRRTWVPL